jgi:hypothetical protein
MLLSCGLNDRGLAIRLPGGPREGRAIHLPHLWAFVACYRVNFTFCLLPFTTQQDMRYNGYYLRKQGDKEEYVELQEAD